MKQRGHVALQHRGLRDDPDDNEFVDAGSIRGERESVIVGHHTRESFMKAVSEPRTVAGLHDSPPIPEGYSAAEARAGLRAIYGAPRFCPHCGSDPAAQEHRNGCFQSRDPESHRAITYLPIDGLIVSLDDALKEIREIESRRGPMDTARSAGEAEPEFEQHQRLRDAKDYLIRAQALVYAYAKGPTP